MKILLVGNYVPDHQNSMLGFVKLMHEGLKEAGHEVQTLHPPVVFGRLSRYVPAASKWLAYLDKFLLLPPVLRGAARNVDIVHICDHSYAHYVRENRPVPHVVTCHDLLAVRGSLGEQTDFRPTRLGITLQRWIVRGLERADALACDSTATLADAIRLLSGRRRPPELLPLALRHDYRPLSEQERDEQLKTIGQLDLSRPFILHVGSSLPRKNRECVIRVFAKIAKKIDAQLVFAGELLAPPQVELASQLNVLGQIVQTGEISNELLMALYSGALAFFFPSRFEGFGWPIIEAQSCGCPVVCSNRGPFPEIVSDSALMRDVEDEEGFAKDIVQIRTNERLRSTLVEKGLQNVLRYKPDLMISRYLSLYERALNCWS